MHIDGTLILTGKDGHCVIRTEGEEFHTHVRAFKRSRSSKKGSSVSGKRLSLSGRRFHDGDKVICKLKGSRVVGLIPKEEAKEKIFVFKSSKRKPCFQGSMDQVVAWVLDNKIDPRSITLKEKAPNGNWHEILLAGFRLRIE